jgi:hypothetical protein
VKRRPLDYLAPYPTPPRARRRARRLIAVNSAMIPAHSALSAAHLARLRRKAAANASARSKAASLSKIWPAGARVFRRAAACSRAFRCPLYHVLREIPNASQGLSDAVIPAWRLTSCTSMSGAYLLRSGAIFGYFAGKLLRPRQRRVRRRGHAARNKWFSRQHPWQASWQGSHD